MVPGPFERLRSSLDAIGPQTTGSVPSNARASVLIMLSNTASPDITFTERAHTLRHHPGQLAFPGGRRDATDRGPVDTAIREAREEIGLDPSGLHVIGTMPRADLPVSSFTVVPVVGWWDGRQQVAPVDLGEVASVHRWTIEELTDPQHRVTWNLGAGRTGPAWQFGELFLWGFTAKLVDRVLELGGWARPWDTDRVVPVPHRFSHDRPRVGG